MINRAPVTVVGVTPEGFTGEISGRRTDVWLPLTMQPLLLPNQQWLDDLETSWLLLFGRLTPGTTVAGAGGELTALTRRTLGEVTGALSAEEAAQRTVPAFGAARGFSGLPGEADFVFAILLALSGMILLVVTANVANLLLARGAARRKEIAVRMALGAGRSRAVRHLLAETLLLGVGAGSAALLVLWITRALLLRRLEAEGPSFPIGWTLDIHVFSFVAGLSLLTALILGLIPALHVTSGRVQGTLHSRGALGSRGEGGPSRRFPLGRLLVVAQIALSLVLLAGAGLLLRSLQNLHERDLGLAEDELLIVAVDANAADRSGERGRLLQERLAERLTSLPGVSSAAYSQNGLFSGIESNTEITVTGAAGSAPVTGGSAFDRVGPGYFRTVGARMLLGREIEVEDASGAANAAVINESFAKRYLPAGSPVGRTFRVGDTEYSVVGVVADVQGQNLRSRDQPRFYFPIGQGSEPGFVVFELRSANPAAIAGAARRAVLEVEPLLRIRRIDTLPSLVNESLGADRIVAVLSGVAGTVALVLAAFGLYGILSYGISRRTREFGVRIAMGARPDQVTSLVLRESLQVMAMGAAVGIPLSLALGRLIRTQLADVGAVDLPSLLTALLVLSVSAVIAGYLPARRAARIEPRVALASE
jgi:predicted permease